jgi:hypothetical protein
MADVEEGEEVGWEEGEGPAPIKWSSDLFYIYTRCVTSYHDLFESVSLTLAAPRSTTISLNPHP